MKNQTNTEEVAGVSTVDEKSIQYGGQSTHQDLKRRAEHPFPLIVLPHPTLDLHTCQG